MARTGLEDVCSRHSSSEHWRIGSAPGDCCSLVALEVSRSLLRLLAGMSKMRATKSVEYRTKMIVTLPWPYLFRQIVQYQILCGV